MRLTGHEIVAAAVTKAGGGVALAKAIRMGEFSDADGKGAQIMRWAKDGGPKPPGEAVIRCLDYMQAINWKAVEKFHPVAPEAAAVRILDKSAAARKRVEQRPSDRPGRAQQGSNP